MIHSGTLTKLLRNASKQEIYGLWLLVIPPVIATWVTIFQTLGITGVSLKIITACFLVAYAFSFVLILRLINGVDKHRVLRDCIVDYLIRNEFRMASFERLATKEEMAASEEEIAQMIDIFPETFRRATLKGGRPGLALTNHTMEN